VVYIVLSYWICSHIEQKYDIWLLRGGTYEYGSPFGNSLLLLDLLCGYYLYWIRFDWLAWIKEAGSFFRRRS